MVALTEYTPPVLAPPPPDTLYQSIEYSWAWATTAGMRNTAIFKISLFMWSFWINSLVFGRKLSFSEAARDVESLGRPVNGSFCVRPSPNRQNSPTPVTLRLSDLVCGFKWGGFQAARRAVAARAHSRASNFRPITCRL